MKSVSRGTSLTNKPRIAAALLVCALGGGILQPAAEAARARIPERVGTPYLGAIVVDADTGEVVLEEHADASFYPASIVKLMALLIVQEKIEEGSIRLADPVRATAEAAGMGGSQVYLAENEVFPVEDLLYALIIQSANDAAVALAIHVAGSHETFVEMMRQRAAALGMKETEFHTVHGLPPARGQKPDISTPRDIATLARELLKHPDILRYTSAQLRGFRDGRFEMRSHNRLLGTLEGCDGLKTGYFTAGGFSIAASASRGGKRFVSVVAGARDKKVRDASARQILAKAFSDTPARSRPQEARPASRPEGPVPSAGKASAPPSGGAVRLTLLVLLIAVLGAVFFWLGRLSRREDRPGSRFSSK